MSSKLVFQILLALIATVPILTASPAALKGLPVDSLGNEPHYDNEYRYFAAIWVGLGFSLYLLIPHIESQTFMFRTICGIIFFGGLSRINGMIQRRYSLPSNLRVALFVELVLVPVMVAWQSTFAIG